jgi:hypothetical protein
VEGLIVHLWMEPTVCPTGGHGTPVLYLDCFSYCLRTNNILAGRIVMSPLWDIIILQSVMMTRVARWRL